MFEVPDAKRIKRSELNVEDQGNNDEIGPENPPNSARAEDSDSAETTNPPDYGFEYDFIDPTTVQDKSKPAPTQLGETPSYEFRLFSNAPKSTSGTPAAATTHETKTAPSHLITLTRSPSPSSTLLEPEGHFLRRRPDSYYFTRPQSSLKAQHTSTAISPASLLTLLHTPWPGTHLPWRVHHIPSSQLHKSLSSTTNLPNLPPSTTRGRSKPNKTRRLALRRLLAARLHATHQAQQAKSNPNPQQPKAKPKPAKIANAKGELELDLLPEEREKRTARNREKKVKKRQRERERKARGDAEGIDGGGGVGGEGGEG